MLKTFRESKDHMKEIRENNKRDFYCLLKQSQLNFDSILHEIKDDKEWPDIKQQHWTSALSLLVEDYAQSKEIFGADSSDLGVCIKGTRLCSLKEYAYNKIMSIADSKLDIAKKFCIEDYKLSFTDDEKEILRSVLTGENAKQMEEYSRCLIKEPDLMKPLLDGEIDRLIAELKHTCQLPSDEQWMQYVVPNCKDDYSSSVLDPIIQAPTVHFTELITTTNSGVLIGANHSTDNSPEDV